MSGTERQRRRWFTVALPVSAAAAVYGWVHWYLAGPSSPPTAVAVAGGVLLVAGACAAYVVRVGGTGGFFGVLFLAVGLLLTVTAADQATARAEVATCVVGEVHTTVQASYGEGGPPEKTVYRLELRCPGGYPAELKDDRPLAAVGEEIEVAYDPQRRVSPAPEGGSSPWRAALWALVLLAAGTEIARRCAPGPDVTAGA
ncbi:hypothetical protein [Streptomyces sp. NRRL S-241]|uniref:hypothetical protein n=1 Tax=Streptomyces sp. NRRL S-241 TaxID=1463896 RepID=UPI00131C86F7|nr:hypothetical protein [Streptomyces sp. NRRL S-241]